MKLEFNHWQFLRIAQKRSPRQSAPYLLHKNSELLLPVLQQAHTRSYNSIYQAIKASFNTSTQEMNKEEEKGGEEEEEEEEEEEKSNNLIRVVSELIDQPQQSPFYLFATDLEFGKITDYIGAKTLMSNCYLESKLIFK